MCELPIRELAERLAVIDCDYSLLATRGVRGLTPYEPGKPLTDLQRELGRRDIVKLASNENPLGPGPRASAAIVAAVPDAARYPDGNATALRQGLAERVAVTPEALTLGNGSNEVLELVARAFLTPEHEVVFSEHAFAVYALVTQAVGAKAVETRASKWGHDLEAMAAAVTSRTRLVFIANPNNPTGTWLSARALRQFLDQVPTDVLVVVDEAYCEYVEHEDYPNCVSWVAHYPNLIVTRTFSKAYGLAGLRVGWAVSHPGIAELLNRVRQPFNLNALAQAGASAALQDTSHLARTLDVNRAGRSQLQEAFASLGLEYIPSVANFVAVDVGRSAAGVYQGLLREGVIVRPVANYGLPNHLRVTVGQEPENARFVAALASVLGRG